MRDSFFMSNMSPQKPISGLTRRYLYTYGSMTRISPWSLKSPRCEVSSPGAPCESLFQDTQGRGKGVSPRSFLVFVLGYTQYRFIGFLIVTLGAAHYFDKVTLQGNEPRCRLRVRGIDFQNLVDSTCGQIIHPVESVRWKLSDKGGTESYIELRPETSLSTYPLI